MKMKRQALLVALLAGSVLISSPRSLVAQADDQPSPKDQAATATATKGVAADDTTVESDREKTNNRRGRHREAVVHIGSDAELRAGETAEAVVAVGGSAISRGDVRDAVVAVGGDVTVSGEVGDAVVAVLGDVNIEAGGKVQGDVVSVGGTITIADGAEIAGEIVAVGGEVRIAEGAKTGRGVQEIPAPGLRSLRGWLVHCFFKMRPLAPQVGGVWVVAGVVFLIYLIVAALFPKPVEACVGEITRRPVTTFLTALFAILLIPLILVIVAATGVGLIVVPFLLAALLFGAIVGKAAFLEFLGLSVGRAFGGNAVMKPLLAFLIGSIILTVLYLVPVIGLVTLGVTAVWGFGAAVTAVFASVRRERAARRAAQPTPDAPAGTMNAGAAAARTATEGNPGPAISPIGAPLEGAASPGPMAAPVTAPAAASEAFAYPRASFWERMGAGFLDIVLVSIVSGWLGPFWLVVTLAYFSGMWAWRGTTIGGIVVNLKVVRLDDQPVTFPVALVRALAAAFSVVVLFLGFFWIAWDKEKQGWHDKIAGTAVVRQPRGTPLLCL